MNCHGPSEPLLAIPRSEEFKQVFSKDDDGLKVPAHAVWIVCVTVFIDSLGGSISAPVLPYYAQEFNASSSAVGFLFSAYSLSQVACLPLLGGLADRIGRRRVLVLSLVGAAIGAFMQGFATSLMLLMLARVVSGSCGAVGSTANVYVSDVTCESRRAKYLGYLMSSNGLAFALGPGLGGGLSKLGLNVPILVDGVLTAVAAVIAWVYLPESPVWVQYQRDSACKSLQRPANTSRLTPFSSSVWVICAVELLRGFAFSAIFGVFGLYALSVYQFDSLHTGFAVCVGALILMCTTIWIMPLLSTTLDEVWCAALGMLLIAVGLFGVAFTPCIHLALIGMWTTYMGQAIAGCNIAAITSILSSDDNRGAVMSMQQMAQAMGRVIGPASLCYLLSLNATYPFALAAAAASLAAVLLMCISKSYRIRVSMSDLDFVTSFTELPEEDFTDEDALEMGRYLCELLSKRHYRWRAPEQREALKRQLGSYFPPIQQPSLLENAHRSSGAFDAVGYFSHSPLLGRRRMAPGTS